MTDRLEEIKEAVNKISNYNPDNLDTYHQVRRQDLEWLIEQAEKAESEDYVPREWLTSAFSERDFLKNGTKYLEARIKELEADEIGDRLIYEAIGEPKIRPIEE